MSGGARCAPDEPKGVSTLSRDGQPFGDGDYRGLFEDHAAIKLVIDPGSGRIVDANRAAATFYGWSREELRSMLIEDINCLSAADIAGEMERVRNAGYANLEFRHRRADGSIRDVDVYSSPIVTEAGELLHSIVIDATERKQVRRDLAESEQYLRTILETTTDGFWLIDLDGRIVDANSAYCRMSGYEREEILELRAYDIDADMDEHGVHDQIRKIVHSGNEVFETRHVRRDGSVFDVEVTASALDSYGGALVCFCRDISPRKANERRIQSLLAQQEVIMGEVHHRIKNDMILVRSMLELQAGASDEAHCVHALQDAARRVEVFSRAYTHMYENDSVQWVHLPALVNDLVEDLGDSAVPRGVRVEVDVADITIAARESVSVGIILNELVTNAAKYAFNGGGGDRLVVAAAFDGTGTLRLEISDNGPGFPASSLHDGEVGYGITVARTLAEQHDGYIELENDGGARATAVVRVTLA